MGIDVIFVDGHPILRDGLRSFFSDSSKGIKVVGEANNGKDFLDIV